jgi:hypothetical protein
MYEVVSSKCINLKSIILFWAKCADLSATFFPVHSCAPSLGILAHTQRPLSQLVTAEERDLYDPAAFQLFGGNCATAVSDADSGTWTLLDTARDIQARFVH